MRFYERPDILKIFSGFKKSIKVGDTIPVIQNKALQTGFYGIMDLYNKTAEIEIKEIKSLFGGDGLNDINKKAFTEYYSNTINGIKTEIDYIVGKVYLSAISDLVGFDNVFSQLQNSFLTEVNTYLMNTNRIYRNTLGEQNKVELWEYFGANDEVTREICRRYLNQRKTLKEWKEISNNQNGNIATAGGGYNCRHFLRPIIDKK